ncbi:hypothetical protein [Lysobacter gummosus]|uniref:hypothetical protein n=1 Tax=Lysobacter gummosus TaxID=262324 RepID=UPI0036273A46
MNTSEVGRALHLSGWRGFEKCRGCVFARAGAAVFRTFAYGIGRGRAGWGAIGPERTAPRRLATQPRLAWRLRAPASMMVRFGAHRIRKLPCTTASSLPPALCATARNWAAAVTAAATAAARCGG